VDSYCTTHSYNPEDGAFLNVLQFEFILVTDVLKKPASFISYPEDIVTDLLKALSYGAR
jgi:hypothetical protein